MTASQKAKENGFKSLRQVAELSGVKERTLFNWYTTKPVLFDIVLLGLKAKIEKN